MVNKMPASTARALPVSKVHPDFQRAVRLLERGQAGQALVLADSLIKSSDEMSRLDGYMSRGMVFEDGGVDVEIDLERSLDSYRRASLIVPDAVTFLNLARVSLKQRNFAVALKFLEISAEYEVLPETLLGFGAYYEAVVPMDGEAAKSHFMKAAMKWRFAGFFGYSRVARAMGQPVRAFLMDCLRIAAGPWIALAVGTRARFPF